ncbi:hypothetical protein GCM10025791_25630 [Halioxenophilus aromaticivorans]|uniref:Uncharacterized protein n=1 Tax=Halioxenophilus aromaticivorans TaxID=1306992 RepID=A0AAV3U3Z6_9ALTE
MVIIFCLSLIAPYLILVTGRGSNSDKVGNVYMWFIANTIVLFIVMWLTSLISKGILPAIAALFVQSFVIYKCLIATGRVKGNESKT